MRTRTLGGVGGVRSNAAPIPILVRRLAPRYNIECGKLGYSISLCSAEQVTSPQHSFFFDRRDLAATPLLEMCHCRSVAVGPREDCLTRRSMFDQRKQRANDLDMHPRLP